MARVFKVIPRRPLRRNGQFLTPDMVVIVTTRSHSNSPFNNGAEEVQEAYMHIYGFDYKKAGCSKNDFDFEVLG